jgi:fucose permease
MPMSSRRTLLLIAAAGMAVHGIVLSLTGPILPSLMEAFALQEARAGLLLASGWAGFLMGTLGGGALVDRRSLKWAYLMGLGSEVLALGALAVAPTFYAACAASMALSLGAGIIEATLNTIPTRMPARDQRHGATQQAGSLMNVIHLFFSVGAFAAPLVIGALLESGWGWRTIYWGATIPALGMLLAVLRGRVLAAPLQPAAGKRDDVEMGRSTWELLRQRPVILGALVLLFYSGAELGITSWVVLYLQQELHLPIGLASAGLSVFWIAIMVGRYGVSRMALRFSQSDLVIASGIAGALCYWGLLTTRDTVLAFGWLVLAGLLSAGVFPLAMANVNSRYPRSAGRVSGLLAAWAGIGGMVFPPLLGVVAQATSLHFAMVLNGLCMIGVAGSFAFMPRGAARLATEVGTEM